MCVCVSACVLCVSRTHAVHLCRVPELRRRTVRITTSTQLPSPLHPPPSQHTHLFLHVMHTLPPAPRHTRTRAQTRTRARSHKHTQTHLGLLASYENEKKGQTDSSVAQLKSLGEEVCSLAHAHTRTLIHLSTAETHLPTYTSTYAHSKRSQVLNTHTHTHAHTHTHRHTRTHTYVTVARRS